MSLSSSFNFNSNKSSPVPNISSTWRQITPLDTPAEECNVKKAEAHSLLCKPDLNEYFGSVSGMAGGGQERPGVSRNVWGLPGVRSLSPPLFSLPLSLASSMSPSFSPSLPLSLSLSLPSPGVSGSVPGSWDVQGVRGVRGEDGEEGSGVGFGCRGGALGSGGGEAAGLEFKVAWHHFCRHDVSMVCCARVSTVCVVP